MRARGQAFKTAYQGATFYSKLQTPDGHWPADYGGPLFLLPGLIMACEFCHIPLSAPKRIAMIRFLSNHQQVDGGWGIHIESPSTMFGTILNYVGTQVFFFRYPIDCDHHMCVHAKPSVLIFDGRLRLCVSLCSHAPFGRGGPRSTFTQCSGLDCGMPVMQFMVVY